MKKLGIEVLNDFAAGAKADFKTLVTADEKRRFIEAAKVAAKEHVPAPWDTFAIIALDAIEATIQG